MGIRVGINGFGRIGRAILRLAAGDPYLEVVHINDLTPTDQMAFLFKRDDVQGTFPGKVELTETGFRVEGRDILCSNATDPKEIPWGQSHCDIVLECTGRFKDRPYSAEHLRDGVKKVIVSAPGKGSDITIVMGVNQDQYRPDQHQIISNASCTTNCLAPVAMVLDETYGIINGFMTTIHSYTNDQRVLSGPHHDPRRARAAALNQIPTTTGAARAIGLVLPHLAGKLEGISIRVPTPNVSLVDLVTLVSKEADIKGINEMFQQVSQGRLKGILDYSDEPLVSSDYNGSTFSGVVDGLSTNVIGGNLLKVLAWYDNENGFSSRMIDLTKMIGKSIG